MTDDIERINVANILKVADAMEAAARPRAHPKLGYCQKYWLADADDDAQDATGHNCHTTSCIAGWAVLVIDNLSIKRLREHEDTIGLQARAEELFGLGYNQNRDLLFHLREQPITQAVRTLRHLAKTGEVNWSIGQ